MCPDPFETIEEQFQEWEQLKGNLEHLAVQLDDLAWVCQKHILHLDLKKAKAAKALAKDCRRLASRTLTWPGLSAAAQRGEEQVLWELYVQLRRKAKHLLGNRFQLRTLSRS